MTASYATSHADAMSHDSLRQILGMKPHEFYQALLTRKGTNSNALAITLKKPSLQGTLSKFERGKTANPRSAWVVPLAKLLDVPAEAFWSEEKATEVAKTLGLNMGVAESRPTYRIDGGRRIPATRIDPGLIAIQIGNLMRPFDDVVRASAAALFGGAAIKPEEAEGFAARLRGLLAEEPRKTESQS